MATILQRLKRVAWSILFGCFFLGNWIVSAMFEVPGKLIAYDVVCCMLQHVSCAARLLRSISKDPFRILLQDLDNLSTTFLLSPIQTALRAIQIFHVQHFHQNHLTLTSQILGIHPLSTICQAHLLSCWLYCWNPWVQSVLLCTTSGVSTLDDIFLAFDHFGMIYCEWSDGQSKSGQRFSQHSWGNEIDNRLLNKL